MTSEFNSHLAIPTDQMSAGEIRSNAVIHCQPFHLTYLSHIPRYQDERYMNTHLLRWQPETILNLPEGLGMLPFILPGSQEQMRETGRVLRSHRVAVWSQHDVIVRCADSVRRALDLIEYVETAARYEYLNLVAHERSEGLSPQQIRAICEAWNVRQRIF